MNFHRLIHRHECRYLFAVFVFIVVIGIAISFIFRVNEPPWRIEAILPHGNDGPVLDIAFSRNGEMLASAGCDNKLRIWNLGKDNSMKVLLGHSADVVKVIFVSDNKSVISCSRDRTGRVWDILSGKEKLVLGSHNCRVDSIAASPNGLLIATEEFGGIVNIWNTFDGKKIAAIQGGELSEQAFAPDGHAIATGCDQEVVVWDSKSGNRIASFYCTPFADTIRPAFSSNGDYIVAACGDVARVFNFKKKSEIGVLSGHANKVKEAVFSSDGKYIATYSEDGTVRIWDSASAKLINALLGHDGKINSVSFCPNEKLVVTASADATVRVWDIESGRQADIFTNCVENVYCAKFSPSGKRIAAACWNGNVYIWSKR